MTEEELKAREEELNAKALEIANKTAEIEAREADLNGFASKWKDDREKALAEQRESFERKIADRDAIIKQLMDGNGEAEADAVALLNDQRKRQHRW